MPSLDYQLALNQVGEEAKRQGVDPDVAMKIAGIENRGTRQVSTSTTSSAGAVGIMQVMPATLKALITQGFLPGDLDYANDPKAQIRAGVAALKELNSRGITKGDEMAVGYNGSPAVLDAYRAGKPMPAETANYVRLFNGGKMATASTSDRTSTTTRQSTNGMDDNILDAMNKSEANSDTFSQQMKALQESYAGNTATEQAAVTQAGQARADAIIAKAGATTKTIDNSLGIVNWANINSNDDGNIQAQAKILQTQQARGALQEQIAGLRSTSPLNPIDWIVSNFKAMPLIQQHNAMLSVENDAVRSLQVRAGLAASQEAIQPAAVQDEMKIQALAEATLAKAEASAKVAGLQNTAYQMQASSLINIMSAQHQDIQTQIQGAKLFMDKVTASQGITYADKQEAKKAADLAPVNLAMMSLIPDFKGFNPTTWAGLDKEKQTRYSSLAVGSGNADLADRISIMHDFGGDALFRKIMTTNGPLGVLLQNAAKGGDDIVTATVNAAAVPGSLKPLPIELKRAKNEAERQEWGIRQWQDAKLKELAVGDNSKLSLDNPYKFLPGLTTAIPELAANPFTQYIKANGAGQGNVVNLKIGDQELANQAAARVIAGENVRDVASQLEDFYIKGYRAQTAKSSIISMGLPYRPTYPLQLKDGSYGYKYTEALSAVGWENYLTARVARYKVSQQIGLDPMGFMPGVGQ